MYFHQLIIFVGSLICNSGHPSFQTFRWLQIWPLLLKTVSQRPAGPLKAEINSLKINFFIKDGPKTPKHYDLHIFVTNGDN